MASSDEDIFDPFEIITNDIHGIFDDQIETKEISDRYEEFSVASSLICFKWKRILQGAHRGLYIENICDGARAVDVEWRRNGNLVEKTTYRITGRSRRKVRDRTNDGRLISETNRFQCRPGNVDAHCTMGEDVRHDVETKVVDTGEGVFLAQLRNKSGRYIFAMFSGKIMYGTQLVDYWGEILLPPIRTQRRVMSFRPNEGETFEVSLARREPH